MTLLRKRWGFRRKPLPEPPDVQPRHRGPHTWHWWDLLPITFLALMIGRGAIRGPSSLFEFSALAWFSAVLALLSWGIAMPKDGRLGDLARRAGGTNQGRVVAWSLFLGITSGVAYVVYWIADNQP